MLDPNVKAISKTQISQTAGLAQTSESLTKMVDKVENLPPIEVALLLTNSESQIEKFAAMYKSLQPKEEFLTFVPPNFDLLQDIRNQGEIIINNRNANNQFTNGSNTGQSTAVPVRRPVVRQGMSTNGGTQWNESPQNESTSTSPVSSTIVTNTNSSFVVSNKTYASMVKPQTALVGQCVLGAPNHVAVKPALAPSK